MKFTLEFETENPTESGMYLVKGLIDGNWVITEATYVAHKNEWSVELYQLYDPHWDEIIIKVEKWAKFPWGDV